MENGIVNFKGKKYMRVNVKEGVRQFRIKEMVFSLIYGKKCPKCGHRNHSYLLDDNSFSYGLYLHKCDNCKYEY
jgi:hypothetical protein